MKSNNKILIGIAVFFGVLLLTNPSHRDFNSYINAKALGITKPMKYGRTSNYLIFSIYEVTYGYEVSMVDKDWNPIVEYDPPKRYIGVLKNFIKLKTSEAD